jgi:predicted secreted protein
MWSFRVERKDIRSRRIVFLVECLLNQNARGAGTANSPAVSRPVIDLLADRQVGMVQIPCPEIACLGCARRRVAGQSLRDALEAPGPTACWTKLAMATADRIQCYLDQGYEVLAVLGGNQGSSGCAVRVEPGSFGHMANNSGVFMKALATELTQRGLRIPFHGMRDSDPTCLKEDLTWLHGVL